MVQQPVCTLDGCLNAGFIKPHGLTRFVQNYGLSFSVSCFSKRFVNQTGMKNYRWFKCIGKLKIFTVFEYAPYLRKVCAACAACMKVDPEINLGNNFFYQRVSHKLCE